ncbi:MAG: hypothetical protein JWL77_3377 [Chthonomonadaceae bacterium]|nr:hypothetical protein [Chthonomonadaceae bacterium]
MLAAVQLGKMGEISVVPALVEMLQSQDAGVRAHAAATLTEMGAPVVGALLQFLPHRPVERMVGTVL